MRSRGTTTSSHHPSWTRLVATGAWLCALLMPSAALGEEPDVRVQRLRGLSAQDLEVLSPHLARGPVALVEFTSTHEDDLPAINAAIRVRAPVQQVVDAITHPEHYARFLGTVDEVELVSRGPRTVIYDWAWSMAVFRMRGRNVMRVYPAPPGAPARGVRITVDNQAGDMGTGRTSIRVLPQPDGTSLLCISMRLDLREANYVARRMSEAARSVNRSANMALTYALLLGIGSEAERRAGSAPHPSAKAAAALAPPPFDRRRIEPLLRRGDLVLMDLWGQDAGRVTVLGTIFRGEDVVREVMLDAEGFGSALIPGSGATVVSRDAQQTVFDWEIGLPLVGVSGRMRLWHGEPRAVSIMATDGALQGGQWHFRTEPRGHRRSVVLSWARFDLRRTSFWLRQLVDADPQLGHGIEAASEVMLMRALRTRSGKVPPSESELHRRAHARLTR